MSSRASVVAVTLKWGKTKFENFEIDTAQPVSALKLNIQQKTNVPPERQKIMGLKLTTLKDDQDLTSLNIKQNQTIMLVGTADQVPTAPTEKTVFVEDLPPEEVNKRTADKPGGLANLGNTCYLNSGLQILKTIPEVSTSLERFSGSSGVQDQKELLFALRNLFGDLARSNSAQEVRPFKFVGAFRSAFPLFAQLTDDQRGFMQQDAEECWSTLVTVLSQHLTLSSGDAMSDLQNGAIQPLIPSTETLRHNLGDLLFGIEMQCKYKCLEVEEGVESPHTASESVRKISCHISDKTAHLYTAVEESLSETIEKNSSSLGRQANYSKTCAISRLPPYLVIQFVRFAWRNDTQKRAKILRSISFPDVLDLYKMCTPELQANISAVKEVLEKEKDEALAASAHKSDSDAMETDTSPAAVASASIDIPTTTTAETSVRPSEYDCKTGRYELFGVITHQGRTADGGHYVAWIKRDAKTWLVFDDETVAEVAAERIKELYGGGDWHMAYMCLYRKMNKLSVD